MPFNPISRSQLVSVVTMHQQKLLRLNLQGQLQGSPPHNLLTCGVFNIPYRTLCLAGASLYQRTSATGSA
jgi:hypothetical protein